MRRMFPIVIFVGLIAGIVFAWRSPATLRWFSSAVTGTQPYQPPAVSEETPEKPKDQRGKDRDRTARKTPKSATVNPSKSASAPTELARIDGVDVALTKGSQIVQIDPSKANVKTEAAPVYSFNSPNSPIVHLLKKGDAVETNLEVIDSEGRWSLVKTMSDVKRTGFVRSEDLEHDKN